MRTRNISFRFIIPFIAGLFFAAAVWAAGKPFDQAGFEAAQAAGQQGKKVLGTIMLLLGVFILTGLDKRFETWVLDVGPAWLTQIGTSL